MHSFKIVDDVYRKIKGALPLCQSVPFLPFVKTIGSKK